jgi:hypothetical protein
MLDTSTGILHLGRGPLYLPLHCCLVAAWHKARSSLRLVGVRAGLHRGVARVVLEEVEDRCRLVADNDHHNRCWDHFRLLLNSSNEFIERALEAGGTPSEVPLLRLGFGGTHRSQTGGISHAGADDTKFAGLLREEVEGSEVDPAPGCESLAPIER